MARKFRQFTLPFYITIRQRPFRLKYFNETLEREERERENMKEE